MRTPADAARVRALRQARKDAMARLRDHERHCRQCTRNRVNPAGWCTGSWPLRKALAVAATAWIERDKPASRAGEQGRLL